MMLTRKEVQALVKISRGTLDRFMANGSFPQPVKLGPKTFRWQEAAIAAWLEERGKE